MPRAASQGILNEARLPTKVKTTRNRTLGRWENGLDQKQKTSKTQAKTFVREMIKKMHDDGHED